MSPLGESYPLKAYGLGTLSPGTNTFSCHAESHALQKSICH